jgi:parvulin-like peptidyl-prolyl isomerase
MMKLIRGVTTKIAGAAMMTVAALLGPGGCGSAPSASPTLAPEAFVNHRPLGEFGAENPLDRTGPQYDANIAPVHHAPSVRTVSPEVQRAMRADMTPDERTRGSSEIANPPASSEFSGTSSASAGQSTLAGTPSATAPAVPGRTGVTTAQYQIVGSVLANVNGRPIFADQILATIERELMAQAKRADNPDEFRAAAEKSAAAELMNRVNDEVEYAAAEKNLGKEDQAIATRLTTLWVNNLITHAGGSEAVARQRIAEQGVDFEEMKKQRYRSFLVMIYYDKRVKPLIHVSAQDERYYYEQNIRKYSVASAARFRVIKLDVSENGGREAAMNKAADLYRKARAGADFAELAKANGQPNGGLVAESGWMEKGAYANEELEREIWTLKPGEVTPPMAKGDAIYIAKLEALRTGSVKSFEDPAVQSQIYDTLYIQQFDRLRVQSRQRLLHDSVITYNQGMEDTLMAMVMQKYPEWAKGDAGRAQ